MCFVQIFKKSTIFAASTIDFILLHFCITMNYNPEDIVPIVLNIGYANLDADWNWKDVRSPFARLYFVTAGEAEVIMPNYTIHLRPGHMYLIPSFALHSNRCTGHFEHYYVHLYEDPKSEVHIFEDLELPYEVRGTQLDEALFSRLLQSNPTMALGNNDPQTYDNTPQLVSDIMRDKSHGFSNRMEMRGIIYQLLSRFLLQAVNKVHSDDDRIQQVLLYIRKNLGAENDVDTLANMVGLSKDHLIRLFKKSTGETPIQYITMRKIERAEILLSTTNLSVKEVAHTVGYEDHSYFNRIFKKVVGLTPRDYRIKVS